MVFNRKVPMALPEKVTIREVGPREGFQSHSQFVPTADKLRLIAALSETGVKQIETTSFVRPDRVPQLADAAEVAAGLPAGATCRYTALYLNPKGFQLSVAQPKLTTTGWLYLAASDTFLRRNTGLSIEETVARYSGWLKLFTDNGVKLEGLMVSSAFGCSFEGQITDLSLEQVLTRALHALQSAGAELPEICLADTVGWGNPEQVRRAVKAVRRIAPSSAVSLHLHDTRGLGMANAYAGMLEGVSIFDASVGGMGGCPFAGPGVAGNIATEDLLYLCEQLGIQTGISLERYLAAYAVAEQIIGRPLSGKYARSMALT